MEQPDGYDACGAGCYQPFLITGGQKIYVSPSGDDWADGSVGAPIQSLEKAVQLAAEKREETGSTDTIDIVLRGGLYELQDTVRLSGITEASGAAPLRIKAYDNEKVRLTGGKDILLSEMTAADAAFTDQIVDPSAAPHILQYDLKAAGITNFGEISRRGYLISENKTAQAEVSLDGRTQQLAAWPNEDFVGLTKIVEEGTRKAPGVDDQGAAKPSITDGCSFTVDYDRPSYWSNAGDTWVSGVLGPNFFNDYYPVERFDNATKTVYLREGAASSYYSKQFFRFENIPEELDAPGEYYIDRARGMLYYYPPAYAADSSKLTISMSENDLIRLENCEYITFENITFDGGRASAIVGKNTDHITIKNCDIYGFGANGIRLDNTTNARIDGNRIHDVGRNGVMLTGGDYQNLVSGGNVVFNNDIYNFARLERCYYSGVYIGYRSVGTKVVRNHIHNAPHAGIIYYGANHEISGNEIDNVVLECHDMNAIYANISSYPWERGNAIRRNYFHDLGKQVFNGEAQMNVSAVRSDNNGCGLIVTENLFYNIGTESSNSVCGVIAEGTHNVVRSNLFVDCSGSYKGMGGAYDPNAKYTDDSTINGVKVSDLKTQMNALAPIYKETFPELATFFDEHPRAVRTNEFCGNMVINIKAGLSTVDPDRNSEGFRGTPELVLAENNYIKANDPGLADYFADYAGGNLGLTESARELIDGFPNIQMGDFGLLGQ